VLGSRDVVDGAVQAALVRAFDRLADCREPDKFAGWLFLILRNRCYAERRRRQRQERPLDSTDEMFAGPDRPDGAYEQVERAHALERALQHLTPEQREVFVLKHMEGLAYEEIAGVTGATVASLKMRMHRAYARGLCGPAPSRWQRGWLYCWSGAPRQGRGPATRHAAVRAIQSSCGSCCTRPGRDASRSRARSISGTGASRPSSPPGRAACGPPPSPSLSASINTRSSWTGPAGSWIRPRLRWTTASAVATAWSQ